MRTVRVVKHNSTIACNEVLVCWNGKIVYIAIMHFFNLLDASNAQQAKVPGYGNDILAQCLVTFPFL